MTAIAAGRSWSASLHDLEHRGGGSSGGRTASRTPASALLSPRSSAICAVIMLIAFWLAAYKGLPIIFIIIGVLVVRLQLLHDADGARPVLLRDGRQREGGQALGHQHQQVLFAAYVNMGVLSAVAGIAFTSRLNAASPKAGQNFELDAIAACFIGGASAYGGVGTIIGGHHRRPRHGRPQQRHVHHGRRHATSSRSSRASSSSGPSPSTSCPRSAHKSREPSLENRGAARTGPRRSFFGWQGKDAGLIGLGRRLR